MKKLSSVLGISILLLAGCGTAEESLDTEVESESEKVSQNEEETKQVTANEHSNELTKAEAEEVMKQYEDNFMQVVTAGPELEEYQSKEEIIDHFAQIMTESLAEKQAETFIKEEDGELSVVATEPPVFLNPEQDFQFEKVSNEQYKVTQQIQNELRGNRELTYMIERMEDGWLVGSYKTELQEGNEEEAARKDAEELVLEQLTPEERDRYIVEYDHKRDGNYIIHVFEVVGEGKGAHKATYGWYSVDTQSKEVNEVVL
ncbi:hypothetical protein [Bacillus sp. AK031]